ncbi:LysR family transcriptional regulator [Vibrio sinensis]|uniref:LysR family transcriptional regulator n=1 Tax=Vibrio sinensis TaxID=2302434 RepID=A0A3A6R327_9VIBR|nr:LysR substrate-binding domain-containing protein [Vibrio sinensis]RJX71014.1 LysR family transcriptional regulator [Vibrio sinensis]
MYEEKGSQNQMLRHIRLLTFFDVVVKHMSFSKAADELNLSQPAVSTAIKSLEQELGVHLFHRQGRKISLTTAGFSLHKNTSVTLHETQKHIDYSLDQLGKERELCITTSPAFMRYFLLPKMNQLLEQIPDIRLRFKSLPEREIIVEQNTDCAIAKIGSYWPNCKADHLFDEAIMAVCSPEYLDKYKPTLRNLSKQSLIHFSSTDYDRIEWQHWLLASGGPVNHIKSGHIFSDYSLCLQAAELSLGVTLGWRHLIQDYLKSGRLIPIGKFTMQTNNSFYFLKPNSRESHPHIEKLEHWLNQQFIDL